MRLIALRRGDPYCIDKYEYPGVGKIPRTQVSWDQADAACHDRGARLCQGHEWERACRGPDGAEYPYGEPWDPLSCNTASADGALRAVLHAGAQRECRSAHGVYDMSGNVAEWVQEKVLRGGSAKSGGEESRCGASSSGGPSSFAGFRCCQDATSE
jgi:formylglycine-generating enzyme required for sulfatase activity